MITIEQYKAYSNLTRSLLNTNFLHLNEDMAGCDYIDRTNIPSAISKNYDLVLLGDLFSHCKVGQFCEITTPFNIYFAVLHLWENDGYAIIGPYLTSSVNSCKVENCLKLNKLSSNLKEHYLNYYNTLPILDSEKAKTIFNTLAQSIYRKQCENTEIYKFDFPSNIIYPSPLFEAHSLQKRADAIEERYLAERKFLSKISRGEYEGAKEFIKFPSFLDRIPNKLRNEKNLLIVLNTLMRKAIEPTNIHPFYIDSISGKWAVKIEHINSLKDIEPCKKDMVYDYCRLVKNNPLSNYSSNVRKMINYVHLNLSSSITLEDISKRLNVNATYLSQQFNKEVGKSLPEYVTEKRIQEAKELLKNNTLLPVGKIATLVGFSDINYFARVFKNKTGFTPRAYRNQTVVEHII